MTNAITSLRDMVPIRPLSVAESLRIAERQAIRLRALATVTTPALPETAISELPRIQVERMTPAPSSGASQWSRGRWLILLNGSEPLGRQRFSLAHEFKHVLDSPFVQVLYPAVRNQSEAERREAVCDYFAACLLMPRALLRVTWHEGTQDLRTLAQRFEVSRQAMQVRLMQLGLTAPTGRHVGSEVMPSLPTPPDHPDQSRTRLKGEAA
jgi:predicted transcriptional regulator